MARKKTLADELYNARRILKRRNARLEKQLSTASAKEKKYINETIQRNKEQIEALKTNRKKGVSNGQIALSRSISNKNEQLRKTERPAQANRTILARSYFNSNRKVSSSISAYVSTLNGGKQVKEKDFIEQAYKLKKKKDKNAKKPDILEAYEILAEHVTGRKFSEAGQVQEKEYYDPSPTGVSLAQAELNHNVSTNIKGMVQNAKTKARKRK